jgi:hypothetical protein
MADQVADGVRFPGTRRALHQNPSMLLELLGNADLFGICWFAEQHFPVSVEAAGGRIPIFNLASRRLFSHDIQQGPRQIFPCAQVREDALDGRGKPQIARPQKQHGVAANARVACVLVRRLVFEEFTARRQLDNQALQKAGRGSVHERMETAFIQFFAAPANRPSVYIGHGLEQCRIEFDRMVRFRERELGDRGIELQLKTLQQDGMEGAPLGTPPTEDAVPENELNALRFSINTAVEGVKHFEDFHRCPRGLFCFHPRVAQKFPTF